MTRRGYYEDPYRTEWTARVVERVTRDDLLGLILDETYFYPGGGGQPPDSGSINGQPLVEITEENSTPIHWVRADVASEAVTCALDWPRRWDLMQQHTGQHILSAAFEQGLDAETVSFHLGEEVVTIDLDAVPSQEDLRRVEQAANRVVLQDLPVSIRHFQEGEPITLPLRKPPKVSGSIRIVAIEGFDYSPCGGTHCRRTGEVGPIKILRAERRGQETRIHFLCGWRALEDYARKHDIVAALSRQFTVADTEVLDSIARLEEEAKSLRKALSQAQERLVGVEAMEMLDQAERIGEVRVVARAFGDRDLDAVKRLAAALTKQGQVVALLASRGDKVQVVFARSGDIGYDMAALLREVAPMFGGRGGGQPQVAQGGGADAAKIDEALRYAVQLLKER